MVSVGIQDVTDASTDDHARCVVPSSFPLKADGRREISFTPILTTVVWLGCLAVGIVGILVPYARPTPPVPVAAPVVAQVLSVELTQEPLALPETAAPKPTPAEPPPLAEVPAVTPEAPPLLSVADPNVVAFAMPVEAPARVVEVAQASYVQPAEPVEKPAPVPPVQTLVYGQGEGRQPAPDYPRVAVRQGQEGIVRVRFAVGENGRVTAAEAIQPCPWPLLNDSALRTIRERWRFVTGPIRRYEVAIRFQLTR